MFTALAAAALLAAGVNAQVTATGTMGSTNPPQATMGTGINQTSMARLISLNSIDDFCVFAPPEPNSVIGNSEAYEVAWCVQPRNDARVIPDGTFTSVHFVKTPLYWQIQGFGDLTRINIANNDEGGELDPHGATGDGNPVGGNVTTNATGSDVHYEEWMNYMSYNMFCLRICIAENSTYSAAEMCQHTLDEMGCEWVMPGDYSMSGFTECQGDAAYPPGIYPLSNGSTSTFAQRYTGTYTAADGSTNLWTVGQTVTPQTPYSIPASSQCTTFSSIGNGIPVSQLGASAVAAVTGSSSMSGSMSGSMSMSASGSMATSGSASRSGASAASAAKSGASGAVSAAASGASAATSKTTTSAAQSGANYGPFLGAVLSVVAVVAGAGVIAL